MYFQPFVVLFNFVRIALSKHIILFGCQITYNLLFEISNFFLINFRLRNRSRKADKKKKKKKKSTGFSSLPKTRLSRKPIKEKRRQREFLSMLNSLFSETDFVFQPTR